MGDDPPNLSFKDCDNCPVDGVSWIDVQDFIKKLNQKTGKNYRLPTEAEWEYAACGGNKSRGYKYSGSNNISEVAWYYKNSFDKGKSHKDYGTHEVGNKKTNELGIYDMSGNVWEWCSDWYGSDYYKKSSRNNPQGASSGSLRVYRGGGWYDYDGYCRVANRANWYPGSGLKYLGFRLALSL